MSSESNLNANEVPEKGDEDKTKGNSGRPQQQVQNRRGVPLRACRNCGKVWKYEHYCPAEESKCQLCGKIGHWAQVCRSSGQYDNTNKSKKYNNDNKRNYRRRNGGEWKQNNRESDAPINSNNRYNNGYENQNTATENRDFKRNFKGQESYENKERTNFNKNNNKRYQNNRRNNSWNRGDKNNTDDDKCDENEKNWRKTDGECADNSKKENTENNKVDSDEKSKTFENLDKNNKSCNKPNNWRYRKNGFDKNEPRGMSFRSKNYKKKDENEFKDEKDFDKEKKNDPENPEENNSEEKENSGFEESTTRRHTSYSFAGGDQPVFNKRTKYAYTSVGQSRYDPRANGSNNKKTENSTKSDGKKEKTTPAYSYKPENNYDLIGLKRKLANSFYQNGKYEAAMSHYSRLIELCPKDPVNFNNRCACYMALGQYKNAFTDAVTVVNLDSSCIKGYCRLIKCAILLGEITAAESNISRLFQLDPKNEFVAEERKKLRDLQENVKQQETAANLKNYMKALECINKCLVISPHCLPYKIKKAEYSALLKRYDEAKKLVNEILQKDSNNVEAKYISGICLYYSDIDKSIDYLKDLLRLDPDHAKILELYRKAKKISDAKKQANVQFLSMAFSDAHLLYSLALGIDKDHAQMRAKFYYNMGQASYNLGNFERAIREYTEAINFDDTNFKALKERGMSYMEMKEYEEAIADFSRVCKLNPGDDCQKLIEDAEKLLASVKKDFYEILGVSRDASVEEVKKAYKDKAMLHHPDRHSNATEEQKRKHERKFKDITLAYRDVLERCKRKLGFPL